MGEDRRCTSSGSSPYLFVVHVLNMLLNFETILMDGKMNNIIILQHKIILNISTFLRVVINLVLITSLIISSLKWFLVLK